jgi:hypothetical protein
MGIYLDGMFYRCSGVGRIYENLLEALSARPGFGEIRTVVPAAQRERFLEQFRQPSIKPVFVGYGPMSSGDLFRKSALLRSFRDSVRLFFFPGHNVPLSVPGRYVVSVNDVTVFSEHFPLSRCRRAGFRWLLGRAVRGAETVVAISGTARRDLVREFGLPMENIQVIYPWIREEFFLPPPEGASPVPGEYILYLGLRIAHKNVEGVIRAFMILAEEFPSLKLVIAGGRYSTPDMVDRWKADPALVGRLVVPVLRGRVRAAAARGDGRRRPGRLLRHRRLPGGVRGGGPVRRSREPPFHRRWDPGAAEGPFFRPEPGEAGEGAGCGLPDGTVAREIPRHSLLTFPARVRSG